MVYKLLVKLLWSMVKLPVKCIKMFSISPLLSPFAIRHFSIEPLFDKSLQSWIESRSSSGHSSFSWVVVTLKRAGLLQKPSYPMQLAHHTPPLQTKIQFSIVRVHITWFISNWLCFSTSRGWGGGGGLVGGVGDKLTNSVGWQQTLHAVKRLRCASRNAGFHVTSSICSKIKHYQ